MEPLSFAEIKDLVARRKKYTLKLQKRLDSVLRELGQIETEIRKLDGKAGEAPRKPGRTKGAPRDDAGAGSSTAKGLGKQEVAEALEATGWNVSAAAEALGVHRNTISNKMERFGIQKPEAVRHERSHSRRTPAKKGWTLADYAIEVLSKASQPMSLPNLTKQVEHLGYKSKNTVKALRLITGRGKKFEKEGDFVSLTEID